MTYIISKRIDLSKRELAETTNSIKIGFYDIQHFSKTFLQYVKISPRDYRKLTNLQFNVKNPERVEKGKKRKNVETEE